MFGYSGLKAVKYFIDGNTLTGGQAAILLVASVTAFLVSLFVIRFLMNYIKKHDFTVFGKYRIVLGIIVLFYGAVKLILDKKLKGFRLKSFLSGLEISY